jgi:hypothetical protein
MKTSKKSEISRFTLGMHEYQNLFDVCPQAAPMPNAKLTQMHSDYENV